ncbi:MAG TPA: TraR/DksA C4-type zinc finger protein [Candidatus Limnocylindria bacterium]|nr:TraR/DksA C4-type zinc finger protein [Candidatus Limnocylindria bacterium]
MTTTVTRPTEGLDRYKESIRMRLEERRDEILAEIAQDDAIAATALDERGEDLTPSQHPADVASDLYERTRLVTERRGLDHRLVAIEDALARIDTPGFGLCADCGDSIPVARMLVRPQASRCVECQTREDRLVRRHAGARA